MPSETSQPDASLVETPLWLQTPLIQSRHLSDLLDCNVYLKLEILQPSQSFKYRGISLYAQHCKAVHGKDAHLLIASGGNAGLAAACAANRLALRCTVYIPEGTSLQMLEYLKKEKARVVVAGRYYFEALQEARKAAQLEAHAILVPAYDDPLLWEGHGSMVTEIAAQLRSKPSAIFCSVGGGGLLGGIINGCKEANWDDVPVVALETHGSACFYHSISINDGQWLEGKPPSGGVRDSFDEQNNIRIAHVDNLTSKASSLGATSPSARVVKMALERQGHVCCATIPDEMAMHTARLFAGVLERMVTCAGIILLHGTFPEDHKIMLELACSTTLAPAYHPHLFTRLMNSQERMIDMSDGGRKSVVFIVCGGVKISLEELIEYGVVVNEVLKEGRNWEVFCGGEHWSIPVEEIIPPSR